VERNPVEGKPPPPLAGDKRDTRPLAQPVPHLGGNTSIHVRPHRHLSRFVGNHRSVAGAEEDGEPCAVADSCMHRQRARRIVNRRFRHEANEQNKAHQLAGLRQGGRLGSTPGTGGAPGVPPACQGGRLGVPDPAPPGVLPSAPPLVAPGPSPSSAIREAYSLSNWGVVCGWLPPRSRLQSLQDESSCIESEILLPYI
jgi:hypothetical protein